LQEYLPIPFAAQGVLLFLWLMHVAARSRETQ
jgi:hypothetical protein